MNKDKILVFTKIIYMLTILGAIISFFIVLRDIDNEVTIIFLKGYLVWVFFVFIYVPVIVFNNLRKLEWGAIRRRLSKFITLLVLFSILNFIFQYFSGNLAVNLFKALIIALGLAFYLSFFDITLISGKTN